MIFHLCIPVFLLFGFQLFGQPGGDAVFAGRIVDGDQRAVKGARVILVGLSETRTDDDGLFKVAIPGAVAEVQVELDQYEVVYPRNGRAPVPKSASTPVVFEVKKVASDARDKLVGQLRETVKKLEADKRFKEDEIRQLERNLQDTIFTFQRLFDEKTSRNKTLMDSLQQKIQSLLTAQESQLLAQKKEVLYNEITQSLLNFLDKAKNLRDELARPEDWFLSQKALANFETQITAYNSARDSLYNHHKGYAESVRLFWNNTETTQKLETTYDLALVQIHEGIILPLNKEVIGPVRDYATGRAPRIAASKKAKKGSKKALEQLAFPLRNLELKINEVSNLLTR